jgi:UDP-hydrolysing UDP-N-acetyl-D-glucosamine 2-epimerase|tara:strand:+ start:2265 stop:3413 length:1149 start_codon:yes stop_codon:yes gene_type:complete
MKKKITVFTGSRADYGLLRPLIKRIKNDKQINFTIVAGSHHFSRTFGLTYKEILKDKNKINYSYPLKIKQTSFEEVIKYCGKSMINFSNFLKKNKPDMVVLLGDRYEVFSFCLASFFLNIPISHIHGGELTKSAFDDSLRHSITKLSDYHFVSHKNYKKRVIQLGENPKNVFNVGAMGVENIIKNNLIPKDQLFKKYNIPVDDKKVLITFHPETKSKLNIEKQINILLSALFSIKNVFYIFTYNNTDPYGKYFIKKITNFNKEFKNSIIFKSMGSNIYHSFLKNSDLIIGNSSSGIIEAPSLKVRTLNIGDRQKGRIFSKSVTHCKNNKRKIVENIKKILINNKKAIFKNPYYKKDTSKKIFRQIKKIINKKYQIKTFYDVI